MNTLTQNGTPLFTRPEFIRLPKSGTLCPLTGLSRTALNAIILPTVANESKPPVKSVAVRKPGQKRGWRLINVASLLGYLHSHTQGGAN